MAIVSIATSVITISGLIHGSAAGARRGGSPQSDLLHCRAGGLWCLDDNDNGAMHMAPGYWVAGTGPQTFSRNSTVIDVKSTTFLCSEEC